VHVKDQTEIYLQFDTKINLISIPISSTEIAVNPFLNFSMCEPVPTLKLGNNLGASAFELLAVAEIKSGVFLGAMTERHFLGSLAFFGAMLTPLANAADIFASTDADGQTKWSTQALDDSYRKTLSFQSNTTPALTAKPSAKPTSQQTILHQRSLQIRPLVDTIANLHNVDSDLVMALIEIESGFNPHAISPKGARGLMQLMPATASRYGMRDTKELLDPARNLDIGVRHLKDLLVAHNGQWALAMASYNAGQHAVAKHGQRIPRYNETMLYVPAVLSAAARQASVTSEPEPSPLIAN
jgi:soluble lytic murein transglycosylase-like protein